jgi:hypothetical protein
VAELNFECEPLEAQSVVFHALDYARTLSFLAHDDFEVALFELLPRNPGRSSARETGAGSLRAVGDE